MRITKTFFCKRTYADNGLVSIEWSDKYILNIFGLGFSFQPVFGERGKHVRIQSDLQLYIAL